MRCFNDFLVVSILVSSAPVLAAAKSQSYRITGNDRTRSAYIEELANKCLDDIHEKEIATAEQALFLNQCLMNARIFAKVNSRFEADSIALEVEEKWTLIPAPFFQSSGSTRKAGLVLFETNFLGQGLTFAAGGNTSNKGSGFFGFFSNPSLNSTPWFLNLSSSKDSTIYELIEEKETVSYAFSEKSIGGNATLGYKFPWLNLSANFGRTSRSYEAEDGYAAPENNSLNRAGFSLDIDRRDYKLYFSDGVFARYRFSRSFAESDSATPLEQHDGSISWQHNVLLDHSLLLMASAYSLKGGRTVDAERVGSTKGFRGIQARSAFAESYFVQTMEYQVPLKHFEKGTLTSAVFLDHGELRNRGGEGRRNDYLAPGVGLYFYLSHIAIPGFGLEWGSNSKYQKSFVNFSLGMSY